MKSGETQMKSGENQMKSGENQMKNGHLLNNIDKFDTFCEFL
jgi:hypothetical protein